MLGVGGIAVAVMATLLRSVRWALSEHPTISATQDQGRFCLYKKVASQPFWKANADGDSDDLSYPSRTPLADVGDPSSVVIETDPTEVFFN